MKKNIYICSGADLFVENIYLKQQLQKLNCKQSIKHLKKLRSKINHISNKFYHFDDDDNFHVLIDKYDVLSCIHNFILDLKKRS